MANISMTQAVVASETTVADLDEEVIDYVKRVANIAEMDEQFWADFIFGASLWGISVGYNGAI